MRGEEVMEIHDHFDGCAHCIECGGPCKLETQAFGISAFIRFTLESSARNSWNIPSSLMYQSLEKIVGKERARELWKRAVETNPAWVLDV